MVCPGLVRWLPRSYLELDIRGKSHYRRLQRHRLGDYGKDDALPAHSAVSAKNDFMFI